jgi:hypothetical protein
LSAIDDASYVLSKIEIAAWGLTPNKHRCAVLAALGINGILGARFATGLFRESSLHIPDDQIPQRMDRSPRRPHRNAPLSCEAEGIADTRTELIGHLDGHLQIR